MPVQPATGLAAAALGSICGITASYFLGRSSGSYVSRMRFAAARLETLRAWFGRFGPWTLVLGYFVPGIRNVIGLTSGMMGLKIRDFAPYAYAGAVVSSVTCVAAGYLLGTQATWVLSSAQRLGFVAVAGATFLVVRRSLRNMKAAHATAATANAAIVGLE